MMNPLFCRLIVALHSPSWRQRYGGEFAALLEDVSASPALLFDGLRSAFDSWFIQRSHRISGAALKLPAGLLAAAVCIGLFGGIATNLPIHFNVQVVRAGHAAVDSRRRSTEVLRAYAFVINRRGLSVRSPR
jgi:hypothetical protein